LVVLPNHSSCDREVEPENGLLSLVHKGKIGEYAESGPRSRSEFWVLVSDLQIEAIGQLGKKLSIELC
jgi:hypothetical protein